MFEESLGRAAEFGNLIEIRPLLLHHLQRLRLEHFDGLDVNVAICDQAVLGLSVDGLDYSAATAAAAAILPLRQF
jgi:hypothetical protein